MKPAGISVEQVKKELPVIGGGGYAKVVIDLALRSGGWRINGVLDGAAVATGDGSVVMAGVVVNAMPGSERA
jgi:hypothetical protein